MLLYNASRLYVAYSRNKAEGSGKLNWTAAAYSPARRKDAGG